MSYFAETQNGVTALYFHGAKTGSKVEILAATPAFYLFAARDHGSPGKALPGGS